MEVHFPKDPWGNGQMNRQDAIRYMQALHRERFSIVAPILQEDEQPLDSGSARAERVSGRPLPVGDEDFDGFLVVTSRHLIYQDRFGSICMPWSIIHELVKHRMRGMAMTTGLEVKFLDGTSSVYSGNTPFIKDLIKYFKRASKDGKYA